MAFSVFNLVIGLLATGVFSGSVLLLNKWQNKEPFLNKTLGWSSLLAVFIGLIYVFVGAATAVTLNVAVLFILLIGSIGLTVFTILVTKQITRPNSYAREFANLISGIILTLGAGLAVIIGAGLVGGAVAGIVAPIAVGWFVVLFIWTMVNFG